MADEVPVCEVLCEAMEYLSKLGTNLRTRSDALKEKRIRADKLKNTHAVQKAAKKVLLICELSKKSLDNVESGVKRILTLVDTSQASTSDGGKSSTGVECSASEKKNNFHYFEYNKRKLKITKKIPIKHYMSAKVVFKAMSKSTQDKYPVYHDCKLFRVRRRKAIIEKLKKIERERRRSTKESADEIHTESEKDGVRRKRLSQSESPKEDEIHKNEIKGRHSSEISNSGKHRNANYGSESELSKENDNNTIVRDSDDAHLSPRKTKGELKLLNLKDTRRYRTSKDSDNDSDKGDESKGTVSNSEESQEAVIAKKDSIKEARKQLIDTSSESDPKEEPKSIDLSDSESKKDFKETKDESNDDVEGDNERKSGDKMRRSSDSSDRSENGDKSRTVSRKHRKDSGSDKKSKGDIHKEITKDKLSERKKSSHASRESDSPKKKTEKLNRSNSREHRKNSDSKKSNEQGSKDKRKHEENHSKRRKPVIEDSDNSEKESEKHGDKDIIDLDDDNDDDKKSGSLKATDSDADEKKEVCKRDESRKVRKQVNSDGEQESKSPAKTNKVIDSDSDVDDDNRNNKSKNKETIDTDNNQNKDEDETSNADKQDEDIEPKRPLIKLVSMSKLLKPDVLQKVETVDKNVGNKTKIRESRQGSSSEKNNSKNTNKKVRYENEEEFWVLRRKEVEAFRPKDFTINITRLPKLSVDILNKYNIKKVIQNGSVICEETENLTNRSSDNADKTQEDYIHLPDLSTLKSALLFDSDSDSSSNGRNREKSKSTSVNLALDNENVKKSLLHESDSDKSSEHQKDKESEPANEIENVTSVIEENDKNDDKESKEADEHQDDTSAIENNNIDDDSSKQNSIGTDNNTLSEVMEKQNENNGDEGASELRERNNKSPVEENASKVNSEKMSLLNDSSEDSTGPANKRKRRGSTPHSKRKHIMESMHAKKMLLTYSSSSETEDEKLNGILKKIKKSLLEGDDSDEDSKESHRRKILESSDSGEDILKTIKKTRKIKSKRSSQEQEKEENKDNHDEETNVEAAKDSESIIEQVDGTMDETSNSDGSKMGRSREKPSGSSSHNSDTQDDKAVDGLTNIKSLTRPRRRRDSNSSKAESSSKRDKMPKVPSLITGEGLLEIPSSSEASAAESDAAEDDLPAVNLSGLNGSGITHLAKDDLLGDSDSSSKSSEEKEKDDESDTEEKLKLKRRKAHAISSDSEAGSSRRKNNDKDVRLSDFEDSGDDSEPTKKNKRKKKASDSDASVGSSNEGKKKRRRIKEIDSDGSMSDTENEGRKHGRKNIRKVMGKNQLEEATKRAARQERERMARIAERQKVYNNLQFDESGKPDEVVLDKVVLDFDPETKEPLIELDRGLVKKLKPHQANGIKFMWDACFESVKRIKKDRGSGCILAHCMGLGKTLQVVSLTHTLLIHSELTGVQRVLVVCPLSTVLNWVHEFRMWLKHAENDFEVDVYELSKHKQNSERAFQLSQWFAHGGVCVLGYEMFRNLSSDTNKKFKKKMLRNFQESLVDPGPDMVVCDEGHLLKNEKTSLSQSMNRVKTHRRIVLTGTPLQNNLKEYYCMVQFVKPNLLGKYNEYLNRFVNPITNGQYTDSNEHDIRVMKRRSHVLHKMLDGAVQRRDYGVLAPFLPPKHEYVLFITLTDVQVKLYQNYLDNYSRRPLPGKSSGFLFPDFQSLQRIWTHPLVLKYNSERYEIMQQKKREREEEDSEGSLADFIDDESTPDESSTEESSDDLSDVSDDSRKKSKKKAKKGKGKDSKAGARRGTRANPGEIVEELEKDDDVIEVKNENPTEWWIPLVTEDEIEDLRNSHKLVLLFEILRQCEAIGDKLLVFSQSLYSLDLIEHFLGKVDEATQDGRIDEKLGSHVGSWSPGVDYFRLDGSTSCENRSIWCKNFNREDNPRARLFLISTRAGGLGINLVAANRVIIFDVSWNPSHDVQSIFRVYRFGQKKPCYVYRFLAMGTMEEKIYERQVTKQAISKRVIDEQQIDRHYAENDLAELYKFEPRPPAPRPVPLVPKDRLFAEMLKEHGESVYKFHEHDSLLENKEEETLSEEERKAAWEDFENEKNKPPPAPFTGWPMHNGMVPNLMAQQQQQLAYAALAGMLRKDMPNVTDDQIRGMIPLIYGANPSLMQKLNDLYKYPQPSMMNPAAMMNSVMNSGGAAGAVGGVGGMGGAGGGGGTSGLQYEPPWAREQHQLRLQQLMQQQNQMGAKYYAGGLGSRDPVAMAMQQQRAREIMLGERGRARGRPPLQARATHAPAGDVVNLDSD